MTGTRPTAPPHTPHGPTRGPAPTRPPGAQVTDGASAAALLRAARRPEDVFGPLPPDGDLGEAARVHRHLARHVHPDRAWSPGCTATEAGHLFARLQDLYARFVAAAPGGAGPGTTPLVVDTGRTRLVVGEQVAAGDVANLYAARVTPLSAHGPGRTVAGVWKVARHPRDNDLLDAEARSLSVLATRGDPRFAAYVPRLLDTFAHRDTRTGVQRRTTVLGRLDGFVTLAEVTAAHPEGVDPRDGAWIWRRLLVALGYAHRAGVVHGAVTPAHVLVDPVAHGVVLVDWCHSVPREPATPLAALSASHTDLYPPEVRDRRAATPSLDIWLAARTMASLVGRRLPQPMRLFVAGCTTASAAGRPQDAWQVQREFDELLERMYGPRVFRPFPWPPRSSGTPSARTP